MDLAEVDFLGFCIKILYHYKEMNISTLIIAFVWPSIMIVILAWLRRGPEATKAQKAGIENAMAGLSVSLLAVLVIWLLKGYLP